MEQVLSSPRGHSDWESDQNLLGFLLLDNDDDAAANGHEIPERHQRGEPGIVSLSFDEIFQESSLNLDELFRASRYSGLDQTYPWEHASDSGGPVWDKQQSLPQKLAEKDCCKEPHDGVTTDLISFNSSSPSPTHTCMSMQVGDSLQPAGTVNTNCPLDGLIDQLPLDPMLDQTHSQTLPAQRTSSVEESPDSHWTPENVTDLLCASLTNIVEESAGRHASCNFKSSVEALIPSPCIYNLSSSPLCSRSQPDSSDEPLPLLFSEPAAQPCSGSHAILQAATTTTVGLSLEQEPSIGTTIPDEASEVRSRPQSPVGRVVLSESSVQERTLAGSESEAQPGTRLESLTIDGPPESGLCDDKMTVVMEELVETDIPPLEPAEKTPESDFAQAVLLLSPLSIPESAGPVGSTTTSLVSLSPQTDLLPELCLKTLGFEVDIGYETSCDLNINSDLSVIFASEKGVIVDTLPASEKEPPAMPPPVYLTPEVNADSESQTRTSTESKHNPSESTNSPGDTGKEQTISLPNVDTLDKVTHTLAAVDTHLLLHIQEVAPVYTSVNGTTQHCQDPNGWRAEGNQQPNTQDESERLRSGTCNDTPEKNIHMTFDDSQDSHTLTESSDGSVSTHTPDSTPVSIKNNTPACATLPTPGSPGAEVMCVREGNREGRDNEPDCVTQIIFESVSGPLDPTLLSGAESPLGQVGVAIEQEREEATSRVGQSADVSVDGETDLPDQADLSQVAQPKVNPLRDESPGGVHPLKETCPPLMEDNFVDVVPDNPNNAEMALELCVSSDFIQDDNVGASAVPAASPQDEEHSALRAVFQALDQDGDGFVRIEEFMGFAMAYGVEQVMSLNNYIYKCLPM